MLVVLALGTAAVAAMAWWLPWPPARAQPPEAPSMGLAAPAGSYFGLAWLPGDWLVTRYEAAREVPAMTWQLWRLQPDGSELDQLPLPQDPVCTRTRYDRPTALPDGRLGLRKWCVMDSPAPGRPLGTGEFTLQGYDTATGALAPLVDGPVELAISQFTWSPAMDRGMVGSSSQICASVAWITPRGVGYPSIVVADGRRGWNLGDHFRRDAAQPCDAEGRADLPAWSPDGTRIAFFASPQSIGVSGQRRLDRRWHLYVMDPATQQPRRVLANIAEPRSLAWSPDGRWLAFGGDLTGGGDGVWLFAPDTGARRRVAAGLPSGRHVGDWIHSVAWSPDGGSLAAVIDDVTEKVQWPNAARLVRYAVRQLTADAGR